MKKNLEGARRILEGRSPSPTLSPEEILTFCKREMATDPNLTPRARRRLLGHPSIDTLGGIKLRTKKIWIDFKGAGAPRETYRHTTYDRMVTGMHYIRFFHENDICPREGCLQVRFCTPHNWRAPSDSLPKGGTRMFCEKCQTEFALYMDNPRKVRMGTDYMQYDVSHPGCKVMGYPVKGKQWIGDEKWKG